MINLFFGVASGFDAFPGFRRNFRKRGFRQQQHAGHGHRIFKGKPHDFEGSMIPASTRSTYLPVAASKPTFPWCPHLSNDHTAFDRRVFRDLTGGRFEGPLQDSQTRAFITIALGFFPFQRVRWLAAASDLHRAQSFRTCSFGGADRIIECFLAALHFRFRWRTHANDRHASGQLGQSLLELFAVIFGSRLFDLPANLLAATSIASLLPPPPMMVVLSLLITTRLRSPRSV